MENLTLTPGSSVRCTDGEIGVLDGVDYDPITGSPATLRVATPGSEDPLSLPAQVVRRATAQVVTLEVSQEQLLQVLEDLSSGRAGVEEGVAATSDTGNGSMREHPGQVAADRRELTMAHAPAQVAETTAPGGAGRPLWYRAAVGLEPLRPVFSWMVEHRQLVQLVGLVIFAVSGSVLSAVLGQQVGARIARRSRR